MLLSQLVKEWFIPLNGELNSICHLLVLLGDLTFMGPCIVSIFQYISNKMQRYTVYLHLETALHVSVGTSTHHRERIQLYLHHLLFVTPLLLPAPIVEELEPVWVCCGWQIPDAVDTVVCAPGDGWKYHPKHVEQFPNVYKLSNVSSFWIYIGILLGAHYILHINRIKFKWITTHINFVIQNFIKYKYIKTHVSGEMTPCKSVNIYRLFGNPCNLYLPAVMQKIVLGVYTIQVWRRKHPVKRTQLFT
jgi:hypothetical protein